jgi:hypothetical protein
MTDFENFPVFKVIIGDESKKIGKDGFRSLGFATPE